MNPRPPNSVFSAGLVFQQRYQLEEPLAVGGMAEVWRGRDAVLQRAVAVKLLHPYLAADPTVAERFRREAISAAKLSHPHIVPTYDAGTENGISFIVLGLIQGSTLAQVLRERTVDQREAASIGRQVASALDHAHRSGLIHRDIKPSNVLLVDNEQRVMVADFGIAKAVDSALDPSLTLPGFVVGTPAYVSPEQAAGSEADARSDVYAVGVLLHEMLCNHETTDEPTRLSTLTDASRRESCPLLPEVMRPIIERATEINPADRYQRASDLCLALEEAERALGPTIEKEPLSKQTTGENARESEAREPAPVFASDDTPTPVPTSVKALRSRSSRQIRKRTRVVVATVLVLVVAAIALGRTIAWVSSNSTTTTTTTAPAPVSVVQASSFDPEGSDKVENDSQIPALFDGQTSSTWSTETYATKTFGKLKSGVGVVLHTDREVALKSLVVESTSRNWNAQVYVVANGSPNALPAWGTPVDSKNAIDKTATFDLKNTKGSSILLWITDLGDTNRVFVSEVRVLS